MDCLGLVVNFLVGLNLLKFFVWEGFMGMYYKIGDCNKFLDIDLKRDESRERDCH
jgi:hypothetical protein